MADVTIKLNVAPPQLAEWIVGGIGLGLLVTVLLTIVTFMIADDFGPSEEATAIAVVATFLACVAASVLTTIALYGAAWDRYRHLVGK